MDGVSYSFFEDVDIFSLLALDPHHLRHHSIETILKEIRKAYLKTMLIVHTDRTRTTNPKPAQRLNALKDFLGNFNNRGVVPERATELVERGCQNQSSTPDPRLNRKTPVPRRTASQPGSSPSNPIILDAPGISTTFHPSSPSNSIALGINAATPEQGHNGSKRTARHRRERRTHQRPTEKAYRLSRGSRWVPAPYADESDIESVWEQDWDSDDVL
ncbi:hypothetical protein GQ44DRAFT_152292 [Phaeosphaeriaceae sp. PMI808]|nr:hypothetical protein GQ44DRAFT_152292 [Phaeosphaeriaceae sp. PMI808]